MRITSMYKAYTYFTCRRRVDFHQKVKFNSLDDFIEVMESQYFLEEVQNDKRSKFNRKTIAYYNEILDLIKKHHGKFHRWKRDINMSVIILESTFKSIDDLIEFKNAARFPCVTTKFVYSIGFKGKNTIPFQPKDYKNLKKIWKKMYAAGNHEKLEERAEFYHSIGDFLSLTLSELKHPMKIKEFKNISGHLVIDIQFSTIQGLRAIDTAMKMRAADV